MTDLDASLNWMLENWYYWALILITLVVFNLYMQLKKLKGMYQHWSENRLKSRIKTEVKTNPSVMWKWLAKKKSPHSNKVKLIGRIRSFNEVKLNPHKRTIVTPDGKITVDFKKVELVKAVAETRLIGKIPLGDKKVFIFSPKDVIMDAGKKMVCIPYNLYWNLHPSGEFVLIGDADKESYNYAQSEINLDLREITTDGFAAQMASYSSVKPTWGHDERMMEKESEGKALGFSRFLKKKPKEESED